jgi:hypothetical protein
MPLPFLTTPPGVEPAPLDAVRPGDRPEWLRRGRIVLAAAADSLGRAGRPALHRIVDSSADFARGMAGRLVAGSLGVADWFRSTLGGLVTRHYAGTLALTGGSTPPADALEDLDGRIARQAGFLARFRQLLANAPSAAAVRRATGLGFSPAYNAAGDAVVLADLDRLLAGLARDPARFVGPGGIGGGAKPGAYSNAVDFLSKAAREGVKVDMPRLGLNADGSPEVVDGRHRLAALRARGLRFAPVTVDPGEAADFRRAYGVPGAVSDASILDRAARYGAAIWSTAVNVFRGLTSKKANQERWVLDDGALHCPDCPGLAALGWLPAGELPELGSTACGSSCRCWIESR